MNTFIYSLPQMKETIMDLGQWLIRRLNPNKNINKIQKRSNSAPHPTRSTSVIMSSSMCAVKCIMLSKAVTDLCYNVRANDPWSLMWKTHLYTPPIDLSVLSWSRTPTCSSRPWRRPERECKSTHLVTHCSILRINSAPQWSNREIKRAIRSL